MAVPDFARREALAHLVSKCDLADLSARDLVRGQIETDQWVRLGDRRKKIAQTFVTDSVACEVEDEQETINWKSFSELIGPFFHDTVSIVSTGFSRTETQVNQWVINAECFREVLDSFPLDAVHVQIQIDYVRRSEESISDDCNSIISKLVEA